VPDLPVLRKYNADFFPENEWLVVFQDHLNAIQAFDTFRETKFGSKGLNPSLVHDPYHMNIMF
jgi:hypothetical protein